MTTAPAAPALAQTARHHWILWALPVAFIIHDGEEAIYLARQGHGVVAAVSGVHTTVAESLAAIGIELVLFTAVSWWAWRRRRAHTVAVRAYATLVVTWTLHGLIHLVAAVRAGDYAMGSITALPACLLFGTWALVQLRRSGLVSTRWLLISPLIAIPVFYPLLAISHNLGVLVA